MEARTIAFKNFLSATDLHPCINQNQINKGTHWTFNAHQGQSVVDYLLSRRSAPILSDFHTHPHLTCGSWHRMLTASIKQIKRGYAQKHTHKLSRPVWTDENKKNYASALTDKCKSLSFNDRTTGGITDFSNKLVKIVQESQEVITGPPHNISRKREDRIMA